MLTAQCHIASSCLAHYVLDYGKAMLGTVSALSLTSLGGSGGSDEKLKEEKQKTEAERKKNGTYISSTPYIEEYMHQFKRACFPPQEWTNLFTTSDSPSLS